MVIYGNLLNVRCLMKLVKNLLHSFTNALGKKPVRIMLLIGGAYFLGVYMGWWPNLLK